jgi:membrane protein
MIPDRTRTSTVLRAIIHEIRVERVTFMAGSIAYNAFLSLLPLLFLLLTFVSTVGSQTLETALVSAIQTIITPDAGNVLAEELRQATVSISILGLVVLVWGALRIFRSLDMAFSDIYESQAENTLLDQISDGFVVLVSLTLVVVFVLLVETRIEVAAGQSVGWFFQWGVLFVVLCLALFPMFYLFPDESDMQFVEAVPGVVFTAFGLLALQSLFGIYIQYSDPQVQNSILANIIVFLTWLYFNALVILIGAAINAVLTNRSAQVQIDPVVGGLPAPDRPSRKSEEIPASTLRRLSQELPTAKTLEMTIDGRRIELPTPERVNVEVETSSLPFINDTAYLELHWEPKDEPRNETSGSG